MLKRVCDVCGNEVKQRHDVFLKDIGRFWIMRTHGNGQRMRAADADLCTKCQINICEQLLGAAKFEKITKKIKDHDLKKAGEHE